MIVGYGEEKNYSVVRKAVGYLRHEATTTPWCRFIKEASGWLVKLKYPKIIQSEIKFDKKQSK